MNQYALQIKNNGNKNLEEFCDYEKLNEICIGDSQKKRVIEAGLTINFPR